MCKKMLDMILRAFKQKRLPTSTRQSYAKAAPLCSMKDGDHSCHENLSQAGASKTMRQVPSRQNRHCSWTLRILGFVEEPEFFIVPGVL